MRGAHHAYFWLLNLAEALSELKALASHRVLDAIEKDVDHRLNKLLTPMGPALHKSKFPDDAKCYTDYEPRAVREASLKEKIVAGLEADGKAGELLLQYSRMCVPYSFTTMAELILKIVSVLRVYILLKYKCNYTFSCIMNPLITAPHATHSLQYTHAGWTHMIYEDIVDHNLVLKSRKMEYLDFKYLLKGDKDAGPLSFHLDLAKDGPVSQ